MNSNKLTCGTNCSEDNNNFSKSKFIIFYCENIKMQNYLEIEFVTQRKTQNTKKI